MDEKMQININIAERYYPLTIPRGDSNLEESIRKAAKEVNEKISKYREKYSNKDTQDFLAMVSLEMVLRITEQEKDLQKINNLL